MEPKFVIREPGTSAWAEAFDRCSAVEDLFEAFERGLTRARIYRVDVLGNAADVTAELTAEYYDQDLGTGEY